MIKKYLHFLSIGLRFNKIILLLFIAYTILFGSLLIINIVTDDFSSIIVNTVVYLLLCNSLVYVGLIEVKEQHVKQAVEDYAEIVKKQLDNKDEEIENLKGKVKSLEELNESSQEYIKFLEDRKGEWTNGHVR